MMYHSTMVDRILQSRMPMHNSKLTLFPSIQYWRSSLNSPQNCWDQWWVQLSRFGWQYIRQRQGCYAPAQHYGLCLQPKYKQPRPSILVAHPLVLHCTHRMSGTLLLRLSTNVTLRALTNACSNHVNCKRSRTMQTFFHSAEETA